MVSSKCCVEMGVGHPSWLQVLCGDGLGVIQISCENGRGRPQVLGGDGLGVIQISCGDGCGTPISTPGFGWKWSWGHPNLVWGWAWGTDLDSKFWVEMVLGSSKSGVGMASGHFRFCVVMVSGSSKSRVGMGLPLATPSAILTPNFVWRLNTS